jgi:hypothetical protein
VFDNFAAVFTSGGAAFVATSSAAWSQRFDDLWLQKPCVGFSLSGHNSYVERDTVEVLGGADCHALVVGALTTGANTVGNYFTEDWFIAPYRDSTTTSVVIYDAGGNQFTGLNILYGKTGVEIAPGARQVVQWNWFDHSALSDTSTGSGVLIDTRDRTAIVEGTRFSDSWTASANVGGGGDGVKIQSTGGGLITGTLFRNMQTYALTGNGFNLYAGVDTSIQGSDICDFAGVGIAVQAGVGSVKIQDNHIATNCVGTAAGAGGTAIGLLGSNADMTITGNDITGTSSGTRGTPTGRSLVADNNGLDNAAASVSSNHTIALDRMVPTWTITGTATIVAMTGAWTGRTVRLITPGALTFATGGNICTALGPTSTNQTVTGWYNGSCWYLK